MKFAHIMTVAGLATLVAAPGWAQTVGIGTTQGGATAQVTNAISKVVSENAGFQMRTQVMGGTQAYIPVVNAGELEFGVSNITQYFMATSGIGLSDGTAHGNLLLAATMMTFRTGAIVAKNSDINTVADLRGKRVPSGFDGAPLFAHLMAAVLANGGLTYDDVERVPQVGLRQHWDAFKEGKLDVVIGAVGSGPIKDMDATIDGGVRYISLSPEPQAEKATLDLFPKAGLLEVNPAPPFVGVLAPTNVLAFDYMLWVNNDVSDDTVYSVVKAMYENEGALKETSPLWRSHSSATMSRDQGLDYHPGAIKFYEEVGIWER